VYERLRAAVAASPIPTGAGDIPITISFGVKIGAEGETESELLEAADRALYRAKSNGRNQVRLAGETDQPNN
jgi:diguanylate cyclase (GGDEF)-like protein